MKLILIEMEIIQVGASLEKYKQLHAKIFLYIKQL